MRTVPKPDKSVPLMEADGKTISQAWDEYFSYIGRRGALDLPDIDNSTPISNGQVLVFNASTGKLKPGAN